jgi:hypothetical protein
MLVLHIAICTYILKKLHFLGNLAATSNTTSSPEAIDYYNQQI